MWWSGCFIYFFFFSNLLLFFFFQHSQVYLYLKPIKRVSFEFFENCTFFLLTEFCESILEYFHHEQFNISSCFDSFIKFHWSSWIGSVKSMYIENSLNKPKNGSFFFWNISNESMIESQTTNLYSFRTI